MLAWTSTDIALDVKVLSLLIILLLTRSVFACSFLICYKYFVIKAIGFCLLLRDGSSCQWNLKKLH